jgi:Tol biopolymer transport system component
LIGQTLSHFKITAKLGEGGMGAVYRAQDTKLGREVAIKVLPEGLIADADRVARFEREAKLLAALDHPHIAGIYEVGDEGAVHYLAMQLAEGETLAARISRGAIPLSEAVGLALQIAAALEEAHGRGIVHRDLKPANVMVDDKGRVKVLDFGLAKAFEASGGAVGNAGLTHSPTLTAQMTAAGVILGTAAYMAPEQAKGGEADKRSDIWAFGVLLTEMLTGHPLFQEPTVSETLASVLKSEPDLDRLPAGVPAALRRLLDRCLRKDPKERLHDIADARLVLEDVAAGRIEAEPERAARRSPLIAAGLVAGGLVVGLLAGLLLGRPAAEQGSDLPPRRFVVEFGNMSESRPALSQDGNRLAYTKDGRIWVRDLRGLEALPIAGTEHGVAPFWSPDGEWLGFSAEGSLWKIRLDGSARTMIASPAASSTSGGAVWLSDGRILFTTGSSDILEVSDRGGNPRVLAPVGEGEADFHYVSELPGKGVLTVPHVGDLFDTITLVGLDGTRRSLAQFPGETIGSAVYSDTGHLLFDRIPSGLWAVPFSLETLSLEGEPFPLATGAATATIGGNGTLAHAMVLPRIDSQVVVVDRSGRIEETLSPPTAGIYPSPALSPDGRTAVVPVAGRSGWDLWAFDGEGAAPRRLTFDDAQSINHPRFAPGGTEIYYSIWRRSDDFQIMRIPASGGTDAGSVVQGSMAFEFTRDGRTMLYNARAPGFNWDLWMRSVDEEGPGTPLLTDPGWELFPALSPDQRWLAYSHRGEVFVRRFPSMEGKSQAGEGWAPRWSAQGDRLFFLNGDDMMEVTVATEPGLRLGTPRLLFSLDSSPAEPGVPATFVVTEDGRFVMVRPLEPPPGIVVVQNWLASLE